MKYEDLVAKTEELGEIENKIAFLQNAVSNCQHFAIVPGDIRQSQQAKAYISSLDARPFILKELSNLEDRRADIIQQIKTL